MSFTPLRTSDPERRTGWGITDPIHLRECSRFIKLEEKVLYILTCLKVVTKFDVFIFSVTFVPCYFKVREQVERNLEEC